MLHRRHILAGLLAAQKGAEHWDITSDQFRQHVATEIPRWREVIQAAKVQADQP